jgi:transcriptional regulator with XRE-family HTH domain
VDGSDLEVKELREAIGLTQADAARRADISLATWRRAEENLTSVSAKTRASIERVLKGAKARRPPENAAISRVVQALNSAFSDDDSPLTPTMAMRLGIVCDTFGEWDLYYDPYLADEMSISEYGKGDCPPLTGLPSSVMFRIGKNRVWLERLAGIFTRFGRFLDAGVAPVPDSLAEEYALHAAIDYAKNEERDEGPGDMIELFPGLKRFTDREGNWWQAKRMLSHLPLGFPDVTEDELAGYVRDGRLMRARLHPYRWWEPVTSALEEWQNPLSESAWLRFFARQTFQFLKVNKSTLDDIFEGDLHKMDFDAARATVILHDSTGFTVHLTAADPGQKFPERDDAHYAEQVACGLLHELFGVSDEYEYFEDEDEDGWTNAGGFEVSEAEILQVWRRVVGLEEISPSLLDTAESAVGIGWGDKVVLRITTVHDQPSSS